MPGAPVTFYAIMCWASLPGPVLGGKRGDTLHHPGVQGYLFPPSTSCFKAIAGRRPPRQPKSWMSYNFAHSMGEAWRKTHRVRPCSWCKAIRAPCPAAIRERHYAASAFDDFFVRARLQHAWALCHRMPQRPRSFSEPILLDGGGEHHIDSVFGTMTLLATSLFLPSCCVLCLFPLVGASTALPARGALLDGYLDSVFSLA